MEYRFAYVFFHLRVECDVCRAASRVLLSAPGASPAALLRLFDGIVDPRSPARVSHFPCHAEEAADRRLVFPQTLPPVPAPTDELWAQVEKDLDRESSSYAQRRSSFATSLCQVCSLPANDIHQDSGAAFGRAGAVSTISPLGGALEGLQASPRAFVPGPH
jgi:hypothetical protein